MHHFPVLQWFLFFTLFGLISACYITNCVKGGKRSIEHQKKAVKQCISCGPGFQGRCFGPDLCCIESFGCFMRTPETAICRFEELSPVPCDNEVSSCGEGAKCAADGLCCTTSECKRDERCYSSKEDSRLNSLYLQAANLDNPNIIGQR